MYILLVACVSGEPKSLEEQCREDYVADACFLSALDGHARPGREAMFGMGAKFGNVASSYSIREEWPAKRWGVMFEAKDLPAIYHGFAAACDLDLPDACHELGNFLALEGEHPRAALGPYHRACELGRYDGCLAFDFYSLSLAVTP